MNNLGEEFQEYEYALSANNNIPAKGKKEYDNDDKKPVRSFIKYISTTKRLRRKSLKKSSKKNGKKKDKKSKSKRRVRNRRRRITRRKH